MAADKRRELTTLHERAVWRPYALTASMREAGLTDPVLVEVANFNAWRAGAAMAIAEAWRWDAVLEDLSFAALVMHLKAKDATKLAAPVKDDELLTWVKDTRRLARRLRAGEAVSAMTAAADAVDASIQSLEAIRISMAGCYSKALPAFGTGPYFNHLASERLWAIEQFRTALNAVEFEAAERRTEVDGCNREFVHLAQGGSDSAPVFWQEIFRFIHNSSVPIDDPAFMDLKIVSERIRRLARRIKRGAEARLMALVLRLSLRAVASPTPSSQAH